MTWLRARARPDGGTGSGAAGAGPESDDTRPDGGTGTGAAGADPHGDDVRPDGGAAGPASPGLGVGRRRGAGRGPRRDGAFDRRLITPMVLGSILNPVNSSMLAVALVPIGHSFGVSPARTAWLVSALYLATAVGQPVIGRLVDTYGPRPLYLAGTSLVGVAGLTGVLAPHLGVLVVSRVLLGLGTSAAYPASMFLLRAESERTGVRSPSGILAALSISGQVVAVVGPTLGGLLIGAGGWRLIFGVNVPLSAACLVLGALYLPRRRALTRSAPGRAEGVDVPGMALFAGTLTPFMLFLMAPAADHAHLLAITVVAAACFAVWELRAARPFLDLRVLRGNPALLATYVRQLLAYTTGYAFLYGFTQWLEEGRSLSPSAAGLLLLPMSGAAVAVTALTGRRAEVRGKLVTGAVVQVAGCAALLAAAPSSPVWLLALVGVLAGVPQGLNGLANQNALYAQADPARMGSSAGLLRTFTYLGAVLAPAADAAFFREGATTGGLHRLSLLLLAVAVPLLAVTLADRSLRRVGRPGAAASDTGKKDTAMAVTTLDPRSALVVIDLQNGVLAASGSPHPTSEVLTRTVELAEAFRARELPVVLVRVTFAPDGSDAPPGRSEVSRPAGARPAGWDELAGELAGHPEDIVVTKRNWSAFYGTDLDLQLRRRGVTQIVLTGVATSIGVESTARAAHEHGYHVTLATDAMTDLDGDAHRHSVEKIFPRLGETGTTADILGLLAKTHA
ncbi:isochorismatase family protein [Sphaerisporangium fuscum]|uniref:isochorismatase family protein n=1 Tax=Sphaerisporangium fuscum TaxID=2835868 RepID=UPI001BDDB66D|nr:isochorismatase family protein [Sphaerisporangium fuscum]